MTAIDTASAYITTLSELSNVQVGVTAHTDKSRSEMYGYDVIRVNVNFDRDHELVINGVEYTVHFVVGEVRIHEDGTTSIGYISTQTMRRTNWNGDVTQAASHKVYVTVKELIGLLIDSGRIALLRRLGDQRALRSEITRAKLDISKAEKELDDKVAELKALEAELV